MNEIRAIVLFAKPWKFVDENTGHVREGVSVEYLMTDSLAPIKNKDGSMGYETLKESISIDMLKNIIKVPAIYEMKYVFTVQKGKPVMRLQELKYISEE